MTALWCVVCSTDACLREAELGRVCLSCSNRHLARLTDLELEYMALTAVPGKGGTRSARLPREFESRSPARDDVIVEQDVRSDSGPDHGAGVLAVAHEWAAMIRDARSQARHRSRVTITSECQTIRANHDWVCAQDWCADLFDEVRRAEWTVRRMLGFAPESAVGECIVDGCDGRVFFTGDRAGVECRKCGRVYVGTELVALGDRQHRRLLDRKGMALLLGCSEWTVRMRYDVAEYDARGRALYDVDACWPDVG